MPGFSPSCLHESWCLLLCNTHAHPGPAAFLHPLGSACCSPAAPNKELLPLELWDNGFLSVCLYLKRREPFPPVVQGPGPEAGIVFCTRSVSCSWQRSLAEQERNQPEGERGRCSARAGSLGSALPTASGLLENSAGSLFKKQARLPQRALAPGARSSSGFQPFFFFSYLQG